MGDTHAKLMLHRGTQDHLHVLPEGAKWRPAACRYARVANKPYTLQTGSETDFETHFTVVRYDEDPAVAASQVSAPPPFTNVD